MNVEIEKKLFLKSQCGVLKSDFYFKIINNQTLKKINKYHVKSIMKDSHKMALDSLKILTDTCNIPYILYSEIIIPLPFMSNYMAWNTSIIQVKGRFGTHRPTLINHN